MSTEDTSGESEDRAGQSSPATAGDEATTDESGDDETGGGARDILSYLEWGAVAGLGLVALVAVFRFYFAVSRAINVWISPDFEPLFQAAFNLAILLLAATGTVFFARRLR